MEQDHQEQYPDSEFLKDFKEWHSYPTGNGDQRIEAVFPLRYPDSHIRAYRVLRLKCVVAAIQRNIGKLAQDGIMRPERLPGRNTVHLTDNLILALHNYYGDLNRQTLERLPEPDWTAVMKIHDQIKEP